MRGNFLPRLVMSFSKRKFLNLVRAWCFPTQEEESGFILDAGRAQEEEKPPCLRDDSAGVLLQLLTGRKGRGNVSPAHGGRCLSICEVLSVFHAIFV